MVVTQEHMVRYLPNTWMEWAVLPVRIPCQMGREAGAAHPLASAVLTDVEDGDRWVAAHQKTDTAQRNTCRPGGWFCSSSSPKCNEDSEPNTLGPLCSTSKATLRELYMRDFQTEGKATSCPFWMLASRLCIHLHLLGPHWEISNPIWIWPNIIICQLFIYIWI